MNLIFGLWGLAVIINGSVVLYMLTRNIYIKEEENVQDKSNESRDK